MESITNEFKIHFYEFLEIQILHQYIQSGINYFVNALLGSDRLIHLRYFSDQFASILSLLKDVYFLRKHKGLYAQNFYNIQRKPINEIEQVLSKRQVLISILFWHIIPYLGRKIEKKFQSIKQQLQNNSNNNSLFKKIFVKVFPICYMLLNLIQTIFKFKYLIQPKSRFYNLQYLCSKTTLDYIQMQQFYVYPLAHLMKSPGLFIILMAHKIASYFFTKKNQKSDKQSKTKEINAPSNTYQLIKKNSQKNGQCPICGEKIKNPAVLKTSGFVYCYTCIFQHIKNYKACPLTKIPTDQQAIQLLYI